MANSYLSRTPSSAGNRRTFTLSAWIKGHNADAVGSGYFFTADVSGGSNIDAIGITASGLQVSVNSANSGALNSTRLFRDMNAWYHIVWAVDTTQATASNRMKVYLNGEQMTDWDTETYPTQNYDFAINGTTEHNVSYRSGLVQGYMSHVAFVDGQQLAPTVFGETDSTSGIWKFKSPSGLSWGTNGFHLKFENSGNLGLDSSGQTNNYTVNGDLKQALDTPSNVYATINPLYNVTTYNGSKLSNGNLTAASSTNYKGNILSTLGASQGKWYWEVKCDSGGQNGIGVSNDQISLNSWSPSSGNYVIWHYGGDIRRPSGTTASGTTYTAGDIIGVAWNADDAEVTFYKNGTAINSGTAYSVEGTQGTMFASLSDVNTGDNPTASMNFGNGYFGTTAISSAGSNGNGSLFEYDVPSGYYALNTKNINTYG